MKRHWAIFVALSTLVIGVKMALCQEGPIV